MDPVTLVYYGAICGLLALAASRLSPAAVRLAVGVMVGLLAAGILPILRRTLGF